MTFTVHSGPDYIKLGEAHYTFNTDSSFIWRTTIDKTQETAAGYDFCEFKGNWKLTRKDKVISLKVDGEQKYKDTYKILKLTPDTLILKLLFVPGL